MDFYRLSVWLIRSLESDLKFKMKQILWWMFMKMQWNLNGYADILLFRNFNSMHKVVMDYVCLFVCFIFKLWQFRTKFKFCDQVNTQTFNTLTVCEAMKSIDEYFSHCSPYAIIEWRRSCKLIEICNSNLKK